MNKYLVRHRRSVKYVRKQFFVQLDTPMGTYTNPSYMNNYDLCTNVLRLSVKQSANTKLVPYKRINAKVNDNKTEL